MNGKQRHLHSYEEMRTMYDARRTIFANETDAGPEKHNTKRGSKARGQPSNTESGSGDLLHNQAQQRRHITHDADDAAHASMKLRARGIAHVRKWGMKRKHGAAQSKTKGLRHHQRSSKSGKTTFSRSYQLLAAHFKPPFKSFIPYRHITEYLTNIMCYCKYDYYLDFKIPVINANK